MFKGGYDRNLSYLIHDKKTKKGIVIDPFRNTEIYFDKAEELGVKIVGILNTHSHKDHVEGNSFFVEKEIPLLKTEKEVFDTVKFKIDFIKTPGHCDDSVCFFAGRVVFTGDTLFADRVGMTRTKKNSEMLFNSLKKLTKLPEKTKVYPGHEYNIKIPVTIKREKEKNPYLKCKTPEEFEELLSKWRKYTFEHFMQKKFKANKGFFKQRIDLIIKYFKNLL